MRGKSKMDMRPLRRAFSELREYGILTGEDFTCCQSCGMAEMNRLADDYDPDEQPVGYCFFHGQDAEGLAEDGTAMLAYNGFGSVSSKAVGNIVAGCLKRAGVRHKWNGDTRQRIQFWIKKK